MAIFSIMSREPQPSVRAAIERLYPNHIHWSDRVSFVVANGTAQAVSRAVGITSEGPDGERGNVSHTMVTQLAASYYGWTDMEFWLWLVDNFSREAS